LTPHFKLKATISPTTVEELECMSHVPYASAVGNFMYVIVYTRPVLSQAVSIISRNMHNPDRDHWEAMRKILGYIKGIIDVGVVFKKNTMDK